MAYPAPNGRELAIEALLDREPHGDAYRVSRVLVRTVAPCCCDGKETEFFAKSTPLY